MNQNSEAQNNKLTLNSSVLIKVIRPSGLYIPELKTTVPLMQYSRVDYIIQMLNRGINVEFVNDKNNKISKAIENLIIEYEEKYNSMKDKMVFDNVTDVSEAKQNIGIYNDEKIDIDKKEEESLNNSIFNSHNESKKHLVTLNDVSFEEYASNIIKNRNNKDTDVIKEAEEKRTKEEKLKIKKKHIRDIIILEGETYKKYVDDGYFESQYLDEHKDIVFELPKK